jgi:hypothetical protein
MPFGEYKNFAACVAANKDKSNPQAYCATVHKKITGQWPSESGADEEKCAEYEKEFEADIAKDLEKAEILDLEKAVVLHELEKKVPSGEMAKPGGEKQYPGGTLRGYAESSETGLLRGPRSKAVKPKDRYMMGGEQISTSSMKKSEDPEQVHAKGDVKPSEVPDIAQPAEAVDPTGSDKSKQVKK